MADDTDMPAGAAEPEPAAESGGADDVVDAATDVDEVARLAADVPAATTRRKRKARLVVGKRARQIRKPRCPSCGYFFNAIESWTCPRCAADLREVGFTQPRTVMQKVGAFFGALWRRIRRKPRSGIACGHCDYPARGITGFDCPECGSDLRTVGIIDRDRIHTGGAIALAVMLSTIVVAVAMFTLRGWMRTWAIPQYTTRSEVVQIIDARHGFDIDLSCQGAGTQWPWEAAPLTTMNITIRSAGRFAVVRRKVAGDSYTTVYGGVDDFRGRGDRAGDDGEFFTGSVLVAAMRHAGVNVNDPAAEARAVVVMDAIVRLESDDFDKAAMPGDLTVIHSRKDSMSPSRDHWILMDLYWLVIWLSVMGLVAVVIWRRRTTFQVVA